MASEPLEKWMGRKEFEFWGDTRERDIEHQREALGLSADIFDRLLTQLPSRGHESYDEGLRVIRTPFYDVGRSRNLALERQSFHNSSVPVLKEKVLGYNLLVEFEKRHPEIYAEIANDEDVRIHYTGPGDDAVHAKGYNEIADLEVVNALKSIKRRLNSEIYARSSPVPSIAGTIE